MVVSVFFSFFQGVQGCLSLTKCVCVWFLSVISPVLHFFFALESLHVMRKHGVIETSDLEYEFLRFLLHLCAVSQSCLDDCALREMNECRDGFVVDEIAREDCWCASGCEATMAFTSGLELRRVVVESLTGNADYAADRRVITDKSIVLGWVGVVEQALQCCEEKMKFGSGTVRG